jgi:hypothetical protein
MKQPKTQLPLTQHFQIKKGKSIDFIDSRIQSVLKGGESSHVEIEAGPTVDEALGRIQERKKRAMLPHQKELEQELNTDLDWVRAQVGEKDALDLVEKDWLIVGKTLFFAADSPSYEEVKNAVEELVERRQTESS